MGPIVVGYNATTSSAAAVFWAAEFAAHIHSKLSIVRCRTGSNEGDAYYVGNDLDALAEGDVSAIDAICDVVRTTHPKLELITEVIAGSPRSHLTEFEPCPDLLVVGTSRHSGATRFVRGTTTQFLSRHSACPVVVVPSHADSGAPRRIVAGTDGSEASMRAVRWAASKAVLLGCELVIVHSWSSTYRAVDPASEQAHDLAEVDAACILDRAVDSARERCGVDITPLLVERSPVGALLQTARNGDLLVVGASGHGAVAASVLGSTVNRLLDLAPVPVAVVRDGE